MGEAPLAASDGTYGTMGVGCDFHGASLRWAMELSDLGLADCRGALDYGGRGGAGAKRCLRVTRLRLSDREAAPWFFWPWRFATAKKSGGPLTPKRPAFAFLVTPKLPLGGRSEKLS